MADDDISVGITADIDDLSNGMDDAAAKVSDTFDKIGESAQEAGEKLDQGIGEGVDAAKGKLEELGEESEGLGERFEALHGQITAAFEAGGILIAAEALEKVGEALVEAMDHAVEVRNMSEVLGVTVEQFQVLESAANQAGVGMSMVSRTAIRLKQDLADARDGSAAAEEKLFALGITLEEIGDKTFNENDALSKLADGLRNSATATDVMNGLTKDFGARAAIVAEALKQYHGSMQEVAADLGNIHGLNQQQVSDLTTAHGWWVQLKESISGATNQVIAYGAHALQAYKQAVEAKHPAKTGGDEEDLSFIDQEMDAFNAAKESEAEATRKFAKEQMDSERQVIELAKAGSAEKVSAEKDYLDAVKNYYGEGSDAYKKALTEETKAQQEFNDKQAEDALKYSELQVKAVEKQFSDNKASAEKAYNEMMKDANSYFATLTKQDEDAAKGAEKVTEAQLKSAKDILDAQAKLHQISPDTYLTAEIVLINEHRDAVIAAALAEAEARNHEKDADIQAQQAIVAANASATQQITQLQTKAAEATAAEWKKVNTQITNDLDQGLDGMLKGTMNFRQAVTKEFDKLAIDVINQCVNKLVTSWLAGEEAKVASSESGAAILKALNLSNLVTAKTTDSTEAVSDITTKAAQAAAGAFASTAAIPYVGPELAPAAAASAEAEVLAFIGQIGAAEQGAVIPRDQMMSLHADEMVLPAHISKGIQETFSNSGPQNGGGGASGGGNTYHINAHDSSSFEKYVNKQSNRNSLMKAFNKARSRGNRNLK